MTLHDNIRGAYGEEGTAKKEPPTDPRSILIAVMQEKPKAAEAVHKAAFKRLVLPADIGAYGDYLVAIVDRWLSLEYNTAHAMAFPPDLEAMAKKRAEANKTKQEKQKLEEKLEKAVIKRVLSLDMMIGGKKLRDMTFGECAKLGGGLLEISKKGKPGQRVGDVLSEEQLQAVVR